MTGSEIWLHHNKFMGNDLITDGNIEDCAAASWRRVPCNSKMVIWLGCIFNDSPKLRKVSKVTTEEDDPVSKKKYAGLSFNIDGSNMGWESSLGMQLVDMMLLKFLPCLVLCLNS